MPGKQSGTARSTISPIDSIEFPQTAGRNMTVLVKRALDPSLPLSATLHHPTSLTTCYDLKIVKFHITVQWQMVRVQSLQVNLY